MSRNKEEEQHCVAFAEWCGLQSSTIPELKLLYHVPNGGARPSKIDAKGQRYSVEANKLKRMGVKAGVLDYHLPVPRMWQGMWRPGLWIEFKSEDGKMSEDQTKFAAAMEQQGHVVAILKDWTHAKQLTVNYLSLPADAVIEGRPN